MRNKIANVVWGLVFVILGVGIAGDVMELWDFRVFFSGWWTLFIIIPCLISIIRSGINVGATTGLIIGVMLLAAHYVRFDINVWRLIIPIILIVIGLKIIFQGATRKTIKVDKSVYVDGNADGYTEGQSGGQGEFYNYNRREYSSVFASNNVRVTDHFIGTNLNAIFGSVVLDLREAVIDKDVEISATAVFGGIDIFVPMGINVKVNNIPIFGGVSNKTGYTPDPNAPTIYLNSTTMFGGIDIK